MHKTMNKQYEEFTQLSWETMQIHVYLKFEAISFHFYEKDDNILFQLPVF